MKWGCQKYFVLYDISYTVIRLFHFMTPKEVCLLSFYSFNKNAKYFKNRYKYMSSMKISWKQAKHS